ncbi:MAG: NUDIX domain-containing protein [bacterium]|nr:NUDIX domain-containing protein [bacterium]
MKKYIKRYKGVETTFQFYPAEILPGGFPISTPLTFPFIGQNLIITRKRNGWWDIPGGKMEKEENWEDAIKREAYEEAGIEIDNISLVGYVLATNKGAEEKLTYPAKNLLPVTISFVKRVEKEWQKKETLDREAPSRDEVKEFFSTRQDNGQLLEMFNHVTSFYDKQGYQQTFEYFPEDEKEGIPNTQAMVFIRTTTDKFIVVRDFKKTTFALPGGGCGINESGMDCAVRESREEAQVEITDLQFLGTILVKIKKNKDIISVSAQKRYLARTEKLSRFVPRKDGFETIERGLVDFKDLYKEVHSLQNDTGNAILENLKNKL